MLVTELLFRIYPSGPQILAGLGTLLALVFSTRNMEVVCPDGTQPQDFGGLAAPSQPVKQFDSACDIHLLKQVNADRPFMRKVEYKEFPIQLSGLVRVFQKFRVFQCNNQLLDM